MDADELPSSPRGWRPDIQLLRVIAGSTMVTLLRSFRLYIREESPARYDSEGSDGRPIPTAGILRLDDLEANFRAAFNRRLFVAEQPPDMEAILKHFSTYSGHFQSLLFDRVAPKRLTSDSDIQRLNQTGEVPRSIDWFDMWCFERMQTSVKKLAAFRETDFEGELYIANIGSTTRSFNKYFVRLIGNTLVWYRDPDCISRLQMYRKRLLQAFKQAPRSSKRRREWRRAYEDAGRQLQHLMASNIQAKVQIGRTIEAETMIRS